MSSLEMCQGISLGRRLLLGMSIETRLLLEISLRIRLLLKIRLLLVLNNLVAYHHNEKDYRFVFTHLKISQTSRYQVQSVWKNSPKSRFFRIYLENLLCPAL